LHVLIVDDSADDAFLMAHALRRGNCAIVWERVDSPETLAQALRRRSHWDVVLCDSRMCRLSVPRALRLVRGATPRTPIIVVSGRGPEELEALAAAEEINGVLSKDQFTDLPAVVRSVIARG
jgi:CheY-like chemotaxis protein